MKIFIPLICYNHACHTSFMMSFMRLIVTLKDLGIAAVVFPITFESLISRARNAAVAHFMSDQHATHLLFIDSDIEFEAEDVLKLARADKDVVGGAYAKKFLDIEKVRKGKSLETCTSVSCHLLDTKPEAIKECAYITTGFLLIKRDVLKTMMERYPGRQYHNDIDGYMGANPNMFYDFFTIRIHEATKRYESEDYGFSRLWTEIGGKIHVVPDITLKHHGWYGFPANLHQQLMSLS